MQSFLISIFTSIGTKEFGHGSVNLFVRSSEETAENRRLPRTLLDLQVVRSVQLFIALHRSITQSLNWVEDLP
jgi:hypothetical protein